MAELSRHQRDALDRVSAAFAEGAQVVGLGMPGGFGRHQTLAHIAASAPERAAVVVGHPTMIDLTFGCLAEAGAGGRAGLMASGSEIEVGTVQRAHDLAQDGRLTAGMILLDELPPRHETLAEGLMRLCPEASVLRLVEPPEPADNADPESFHFPVTILRTRVSPEPGPAYG